MILKTKGAGQLKKYSLIIYVLTLKTGGLPVTCEVEVLVC